MLHIKVHLIILWFIWWSILRSGLHQQKQINEEEQKRKGLPDPAWIPFGQPHWHSFGYRPALLPHVSSPAHYESLTVSVPFNIRGTRLIFALRFVLELRVWSVNGIKHSVCSFSPLSVAPNGGLKSSRIRTGYNPIKPWLPPRSHQRPAITMRSRYLWRKIICQLVMNQTYSAKHN